MKLVVLDRDGVINRESSAYIKTPGEWHALPGSLDAVRRLQQAGFTVVVATNQSGLARGLFDAATLEAIHAKMRAEAEAAGGRIDNIFVCPHGPADDCACRKPRPGLLLQIAERYGIELAGTPVVGDSARDLEAARRAGARPILVRTGNGEKTLTQGAADDVEVYDDLAAAVDAILGGVPS